MAQSQITLNKILDIFFHLPTLITLALVGVIIIVGVYDIGLDFGEGFFRLNSNQGNVNLYWINGCCQLHW